MLAVVPQHVIAVFTEARTCAADHLRPVLHARLSGPNPDFPSTREPTWRHLLNATSTHPASVLQYLASTGVDAVVRVPTTGCHDVCAERRLLFRPERLITRSDSAA